MHPKVKEFLEKEEILNPPFSSVLFDDEDEEILEEDEYDEPPFLYEE